jgi:Rieske 2Fe-2S family protein
VASPAISSDAAEALLSAGSYVDELLFDWERRNLFDACWVCVARSEELKNCGDQFAESIGATAILYIRGADGHLRGFVNTCRHQGTQLLPCGEAVNCDVVQCRGHAWTYGLDGALLSAPAHEDGGVYIDKAAHALHPVATTEWLGMVFSNVDSLQKAARFEDVVGDLGEMLSRYELGRAVVAGWREYLVPANWKLLLACAPLAETGRDRPRPASTRVGTGGWHYLDGTGSISVGVFPNLLVMARDDLCVSYLLVPKGVRETVVLCDWAFPPESCDDPAFDPAPVVEAGDAANVAAWERAEHLHSQLEAGALQADEVGATLLDVAVASILEQWYEVASRSAR